MRKLPLPMLITYSQVLNSTKTQETGELLFLKTMQEGERSEYLFSGRARELRASRASRPLHLPGALLLWLGRSVLERSREFLWSPGSAHNRRRAARFCRPRSARRPSPSQTNSSPPFSPQTLCSRNPTKAMQVARADTFCVWYGV